MTTNGPRLSLSTWRRGDAPGEPDIVELTQQYLNRIAALDAEINAWVRVETEAALEQAKRLQLEWKEGNSRGALHGVPFGLKDIFDWRGLPTRAGSALFADRESAESDAPVVAALREAGVVFLGKTVTTELACFDPSPTRNPYNTEHTPGGSSSGSAAAVAAGMCLAALGSQTGGSIIRPASYCGVAGWKGPLGAVATRGVTPVSFTLDHVGPIAPSAADLLAIVGVLETVANDDFDSSTPPRIGVLRDFFDQRLEEGKENYEAALLRLEENGAEVFEAKVPEEFNDVLAHHWKVMAVEASLQYGDAFRQAPEKFSEKVTGLIEFGLATSTHEYEASLQHRKALIEKLRSSWGADMVYATPSSPTTAPRDLTTTGSPAFNSPWSYCGFSAVTIPTGLAPNRMPTGLQLVAHPEAPYANLRAAVWCERHISLCPPPELRLH